MRAAALLALALAAGCASAPPEAFFTLSSTVAAAASAGPAPSVVVDTAAVPDLVDRPQLVVMGTPGRVSILEQQRWAEPLRTGVARVVAESLGRQLGTSQVSNREEVLRSPDCRVSLDVRRFEARPGASVEVEALWAVQCSGAGKRIGQSRAREAVAGPQYDALVAAHGRALDAISRDIAAAIRAGASGGE